MKQNKTFVKKSLGQNFLTNKRIVRRIIQTADLKPSDAVLEIGPGLGALTFDLAKQVKKVIAVEKDAKLAQTLNEELRVRGTNNVEVLNEDVLNFQFLISNFQSIFNFQFLNYKLVANLPYNIATKIIMNFLEAKNPPERMVVMVQKEVAQRICAKPPQMSKLAVFCQLYSQPTICFYVKKGNFFPKPKVDSAVVKFEKIRQPALLRKALQAGLPKIDPKLFAKIVNAGFSAPRKTLLNNLSNGLKISKSQTEAWIRQQKISPLARAETLSVADWLCLTKTFR